MIVKFDHISYSCACFEEEKVRQMFAGYEAQFHEVDLVNMSMKYKYMHKVQEKHNIMLITKTENWPVEITAYESCEKKKDSFDKYVLKEDLIEIYSEYPEKTEEVLLLLGMKKSEEGVWELKPLLDDRKLRIQVIKAQNARKVYLDEEGYGSLAFVVDNAKKQREQFINSGYECSEIEELSVNGKILKIFFTNSPTNEIIEFIGLR